MKTDISRLQLCRPTRVHPRVLWRRLPDGQGGHGGHVVGDPPRRNADGRVRIVEDAALARVPEDEARLLQDVGDQAAEGDGRPGPHVHLPITENFHGRN